MQVKDVFESKSRNTSVERGNKSEFAGRIRYESENTQKISN